MVTIAEVGRSLPVLSAVEGAPLIAEYEGDF